MAIEPRPPILKGRIMSPSKYCRVLERCFVIESAHTVSPLEANRDRMTFVIFADFLSLNSKYVLYRFR